PEILADIQSGLFTRARNLRDENTRVVTSRDDLFAFFGAETNDAAGGFALAHWAGDPKFEAEMKEKLKVTIRCIPRAGFEAAPWADKVMEPGPCIFTGEPAQQRVVFARSY